MTGVALTPEQREARFWAGVDQSGGPDACWPWTRGTFQSTGYGQVWNGITVITTHRMAWIYTHGDPGKKKVRHRCPGGPVRLCCNPRHLKVGTDKDNADDRAADGNTFRGESVSISKLTEKKVREARVLRDEGWTWAALAEKYGVVVGTIRPAVLGETWRHVA